MTAPASANAVPLATTLLYDTEDGVRLSPPKREEIVVTSRLARVFVRAAKVNENVHDQSGAPEPALSFQSLLVGLLVDEDDSWLAEHFRTTGVDFGAIQAKRGYVERELRTLDAGMVRSEYLTSVSARRALEEAGRIARTLAGGSPIDTRHLCAAYPILGGWHLEDFQAFNINRLKWARGFGAAMAERFPDERPFWRGYADRASPVPLTAFSADVYTEDDLLNIDRSVDALAVVTASTRTATPLAVGIFGPWGSGKTFFMRHMQKRILDVRKREEPRIKAWSEKRQAGTAKAVDAPLYYDQIAQVEFNAWHYNEGNLVASLVEHIFRNLRILPGEGDEELDKRRAQVLADIARFEDEVTTATAAIGNAKTRLAEAEQGVEVATQQAESAKVEVEAKAKEVALKHERLAADRKELDDSLRALVQGPKVVDAGAVFDLALAPLGGLAARLKAKVDEARAFAFDWNDFSKRVFSTKGLLVMALVVAAPVVAYVKQWLEAELTVLFGGVGALVACLGPVFDEMRARREKFEAKLAELETEEQARISDARQRLEQMREEVSERTQKELVDLTKSLGEKREALANREAAVTRAAQELAERTQSYDAKIQERVAAEQKAREAKVRLDRVSSALLLEEFIKDRSGTDEYRKQLGFLALVRRDIERLSRLIDAANKDWLDPRKSTKPPAVNRIVLYIDDLDRCKESTVLAVLEAVHLLLAFPLFACVVAVDPRWIQRCVKDKHRHLLTDEPAHASNETQATVSDYLEKIFQIPIWMSPIDKRTRSALVNTLLGPTAMPAAARALDTPGRSDWTSGPSSPNASSPNAFNRLVAKAQETPDPLHISAEEALYVESVADLLSDRPRALKRFVNIYRLLKASLPDIDRVGFVTDDPASGYRICLTQLAIFTSRPRVVPLLLRELGAAQAAMTLHEWLSATDVTFEPALVEAFKSVPDRRVVTIEHFRRWLPLTSRYVFHHAD